VTINELLYDAIKHEETFLAYSLYWSMKQGHCKATDSIKTFRAKKQDIEEINKLIESNPLGIQIMKLYSMKTKDGQNLIVLAENESSAKGHYLSEEGILPSKIHDMTNKMDTSFWYGEEGYKSFSQIRDETLMFPSTVMRYAKEKATYEKTEREYFKRRIAKGIYNEIPFSERPLKTLEES